MCYIKKKIENKTQFTGYKVAAKDNETGKYYSIATGIEYKIGPIEVPKNQNKLMSSWKNILDPDCSFYISQYRGLTAIFDELNDAQSCYDDWDTRLKDGYDLVILKMTVQKTIKRNCYEGSYEFNFKSRSVHMGPKIRSMKELGS